MERAVPVGQTTVTITTSNSSQNAYVAPQEGWFQRNRRNKPQSNSVGTASLIFISGGMVVASSFECHRRCYSISWFIAAMVGSLVSAFFVNQMKRKYMYLLTSVLVIISGIFLIFNKVLIVMIVGRCLNGFATGFIFVPCFILIGEESVKEQRGMLAASIDAMSFSLGIYFYILFRYLYQRDEFFFTRWTGIFSIFYGSLAILLIFILFVESPVYFLVRNRDEEAIDVLRRLQRPYEVTTETLILFAEHKRYTTESKKDSLVQSLQKGFPALVKLCLYRSIIAMSYSLPAFQFLSYKSGLEVWSLTLFGTLRWLSILLTAFLLDYKGRKHIMVITSMALGLCSISLGALYYVESATALLFLFQTLSGVFSAPASAYLTEAYPLHGKHFLIAFTFSTEMLIHILVIETMAYSFPVFFYMFGGLTVGFSIFGLFFFPETKKLTLREALKKFHSFLSHF